MAKDLVYQTEDWKSININVYVKKHRSAFDEVDVRTIPLDMLKVKLQVGAMAASLVEFDPLRQSSKKRDRLNAAVLKELRRQIEILAHEYNRRVSEQPNREELGRLEVNKPKTPTRAKAQVVGLSTVNLSGTIKN